VKRRLLAAPVALIALCWAAPVAQADTHSFTITGVALAADSIFFGVNVMSPSAPCGTYAVCIDPTICFATLNCNPGDTGAVVAASIAAAINAQCAGAGFSAVVAGAATVTITGPAAVPFDCCLFLGTETALCAGGPNDTVALSSGGVSCTVNNVCDGVTCNEYAPQVGGLQFNAPLVVVPVMSSWGLAALAGVLMVLGALFVRRAKSTGAFA
jgi:hypothetical protein